MTNITYIPNYQYVIFLEENILGIVVKKIAISKIVEKYFIMAIKGKKCYSIYGISISGIRNRISKQTPQPYNGQKRKIL